jgi:hypothetical protein
LQESRRPATALEPSKLGVAGLHIVLNEAGHNGKQEARRESAHQHTGNAFYRAQESPCLLEKNIPIADGRVTNCRKVESRLPGGKAMEAIKPCPQQNLQHVQADHKTREPHHEHRGVQSARPLKTFG